MNELNLESQAYRKQVIQEIKGQENQKRLQNSQEEWDVYTGNIEPYVTQSLSERFSASTVAEMPIVSAVNLLSKVVDSRASLYKIEPDREFTDLSDDQNEKVDLIYKDLGIDFTMLESNRLYELQKKQTHLLIEPKRGKLVARPIKAHQLNVIPNDMDAEVAEVYIFSGYSSELSTNKADVDGQDDVNQKIGDYDDGKAAAERFIWWSRSFHFLTNGKGEILTEETQNPLLEYGIIPVVEISAMKDFMYWRELTNDVAKFCVDYNVSLSSLAYVVELQGFAQAYLKSPKDLMPQNIEIGPNRILKILTDPGVDGDVEFGYANPGSDIASSQAFIESLLAQFLSSQGLDPSTVSGQAAADKFNSGIERLLAQIERFEASKETMALFRDAESELYEVIKAYHNVLKGTPMLLPKYQTQDLPESSELIIKYGEPQSVVGDAEKLDIIERKQELMPTIYDEAEIYAEVSGMTREQAEEILSKREPIDVETIEEVIPEEKEEL